MIVHSVLEVIHLIFGFAVDQWPYSEVWISMDSGRSWGLSIRKPDGIPVLALLLTCDKLIIITNMESGHYQPLIPSEPLDFESFSFFVRVVMFSTSEIGWNELNVKSFWKTKPIMQIECVYLSTYLLTYLPYLFLSWTIILSININIY